VTGKVARGRMAFLAAVVLVCGATVACVGAQEMTKAGSPKHHLADGGYCNPPGSPPRESTFGDMVSFLFNQMFFVTAPEVPEGFALGPDEVASQLAAAGNPSVTWLGHAAFIIRIGGKVILTDPYLGENAGPLGLGPKRFVAPAIPAESLPPADVMLISHNHYDHLDAATIDAYPHKAVTQVIVPLGLGPFFTERGYTKVLERDWWQDWSSDGLEITTLPAVHFSGRGLGDRNKTLWASFAIAAGSEKVWFSGDTARGEVFAEIGERFGPFDLALIGIGAYEPRIIMKSSHATPEEAVEIARAVRASKAVGMHWGTVMLTPEDPFEAPDRFRRAADEQGYGAENAWILNIGETRSFGASDLQAQTE